MKSLNLAVRKKEAKRILSENKLIAKRITKQRSKILKKQFDSDYNLHKTYKSRLSKVKFLKFLNNQTTKRSATPNYDSSAFNTEKNYMGLTARAPYKIEEKPAVYYDENNSYEDDFEL